MISNLIEMADMPPTLDNFSPITLHSSPLLLAGYQINSEYDRIRVHIDNKFNPVNVRVGETCFSGIKQTPNRYFNRVWHMIKSTPISRDNSLQIYQQRLGLYNISCESCWGKLDENIFPVDLSNIDKLAISSEYNMRNYDHMLVKDKEVPWYSQHVQFNLYILSK